MPRALLVDAKITETGIDVFLNNDRFPIIYPRNIWKKYPKDKKEILKDNIAYSSTLFVPQILDLKEIIYKTARPLSETFLYKNGIYDMACSAQTDGKSSADYVKRFYNTRFIFADEQIKAPTEVSLQKRERNNRALIPFSFGKESLLSFSLARELGLKQTLVSVNEPIHTHELKHKEKMIQAFIKNLGRTVFPIHYGPGIFRYGRYWGLDTELGTGLWVTDYSILSLPFIHYFDSRYIILGNEQSCNDVYYDAEGMLTFRSAYDQFREWTTQLGYLISLLHGKKIEVISLVEPLYEISETKILHSRYQANGQYQISCFAMNDGAKNNRWCQNCYKCAYLYPLLTAFNIDSKQLGFTQNLFDKKHFFLYREFLKRKKNSIGYGSQGELAVAFYLSMKNGFTGYSIDQFKKQLLPVFLKHKKKYFKEYLGVHDTKNIPPNLKSKVLEIFHQELDSLQKS